MGKWAARSYTVRISGLHGLPVAYYKSALQRQLTKVFGAVEEVIILDEIGGLSEVFVIFKKTLAAKNAVTARTIAIRDQTLSLREPSNTECSRIGAWRKSRAGPEAMPTGASLPPTPSAQWSLPYEPDSRIHQMAQSPIWDIPIPSPRAMARSSMSTLPVTPGISISHKSSSLLKPQVAPSSTELRPSSLGPQSYSTTQASNQANPAAIETSHKKPTVTTGIAGPVATSTGTGSSQQGLSRLSMAITSASMHPSEASASSPRHATATKRTGAPGSASRKPAPVTDAGPSPPATAPATFPSSGRLPTGASTTAMPSKPVSLPSLSNSMLAPNIHVLPPDPKVDTAPVGASSVFSGSHSSLSSAMVPSAVAFGTVQGDIPSHDHPMPFASQGQSQTGTQALNSISSLEGGGRTLGSSAAVSSRVAPANPLSNFQPPLSSNPTKAGRPSAIIFPPSNAPLSIQQGLSNSKYENPFGPLPTPPSVAKQVHPHPHSASGQPWIEGKKAAPGYSAAVTQLTTANSAPLCLLFAPAGSTVNQSDSKFVSFTQEQFRTTRAKFKEPRKAHDEAVNARSKAREELEIERERSEGLSRRLEDAEKVIEQMKREQETSDTQHREELDRARKSRGNEEHLLRELERAKRQANDERELSSKREEELRSRLRDLEAQSDWKAKLKALGEERLKLQQELVDLNQASLRADADAQVELSRQQELAWQLDESWARENTHPELVKAFLLLEGMAQKIEGPRAVRVTGSSEPDAVRSPVMEEAPPDIPVGGEAKRRRL